MTIISTIASHNPFRRPVTTELSSRLQLTLYVAVGLSLLAALIHLWVAPEHLEEWWGYGAFFIAATLAQGIYSIALLRWPGKALLLLGIGGNVAILALYTVTRTVEIPLGPHGGHIEEVGGVDLLCAVVEVGLVMALMVLVQDLHRLKVVLPAIVTLVASLGVVGVFLAYGVLAGSGVLAGGGSAMGQDSTFALDQNIPTSFGSVVIGKPDDSAGPTAAAMAMGGMGMPPMSGPGSPVPADQMQVSVPVTLTNRLDYPVDYSPDQFTVISDNSEEPFSASSSSLLKENGKLQPGASIDASLGFIVPRDGSKLQLKYEDKNHKQMLVNLGEVDTAPPDAMEGMDDMADMGGDANSQQDDAQGEVQQDDQGGQDHHDH